MDTKLIENIGNLPIEIKSKIFSFGTVRHPLAEIFKKEVSIYYYDDNTIELEIPFYRNGKKVLGHLIKVKELENPKYSNELDIDIKNKSPRFFGFISREKYLKSLGIY